MKIVLVPNSYPPTIGGLEVVVGSVVRELTRAGHSVTVVTGASSVLTTKDLDQQGVTVHRMPFFLPRIVTRAGPYKLWASVLRTCLFPVILPKTLVQFLLLVKKEKPDLINLHYLAENAFFCLAAKRIFGTKVVVNLHGSDVERFSQRPFHSRWLTTTTLRAADRVIAVSSDLLNKTIAIEASVAAKSEVIGNGIYHEEFAPLQPEAKANVILCVGNFSHIKGQDILIRALKIMKDKRVRLAFAGDGATLQKCKDLACTLGLTERIDFLGKVRRDDIPRLIAGALICASASRREAFGLFVLEAMASRRAVVGTRVGGVQDIVRHGETGLLVQPDSPQAMAEALDVLLSDAKLASELAQNAHLSSLDRYAWPLIIQQYVTAYHTALAG